MGQLTRTERHTNNTNNTSHAQPQPGAGEMPLHGKSLFVARVAWMLLTLLILALNVALAPRFFTLLQTPCQPNPRCFYLRLTPYDQTFLRQFGLSLSFLAGYQAALYIAVVFIYSAIGAIIFWRRSTDRMALLCAFTLPLFGGAGYAAILQDTLATAPPLAYGLMGILYVLGQSGFIVFFLLFPNGRFAPHWSRWLVPLILAYWVYEVFLSNLIYEQSFDWSTFIFFAFVLAPVAAQVYRYRRVSTQRERQQTKWVVFGFATAIVGFVTVIIVGNVFLPKKVIQSSVISTFVAQTVFAGFLLLIPISIAVAILRSRLYDIDAVINRTLVYGSLTAILAGVYIAGVVGVQAIITTIARQPNEEASPILIVVTTLLIAALFQPLRRRLQRTIDRRFYRRKYNVERTLDQFAATLRSDVDLPHLTNHLVEVVAETMQPVHVSLWLRAPDDHS